MPLINRVGGGGADVSGVTATATDVLSPKIIVGADGEPVEGALQQKSITLQRAGYDEHTINAKENEVYSKIVLQQTCKMSNCIPQGRVIEIDNVNYKPMFLRLWIEAKGENNKLDAGRYVIGLNATNYSGWEIYNATLLEEDGTLTGAESDFSSFLTIVYDATNKKLTLTLKVGRDWVPYAIADTWYCIFYA